MILNTAFLNYSKCLKQKLMINCKAFIEGSACWIATKVIVKPCLYILNNNMEKKVIKTSYTLPQKKLGRTRLQAYLLHVFLIYFLYWFTLAIFSARGCPLWSVTQPQWLCRACLSSIMTVTALSLLACLRTLSGTF